MHNAQTWEGVEIKLHTFLITTLDGVSGQLHSMAGSNPGK